MEGDNLKEITYPDNEVSFSALIIKAPDGYRSILLDRKLAKSIFARLYFLNGKGLRHFKPFIEAQEGNNGHIRLFEIIWD
jgi:hypothetical protein